MTEEQRYRNRSPVWVKEARAMLATTTSTSEHMSIKSESIDTTEQYVDDINVVDMPQGAMTRRLT